MALNWRGALSRQIYGSLAKISLMEALRLFRDCGMNRPLFSMKQNGIDRAIICSLEPFITTQEILDTIAEHRDKFLVFASVAQSQSNRVEYLRKFIENGDIAGLKIHPIVGGYTYNQLLDETRDVVSLAVAHNMPILNSHRTHSGERHQRAGRRLQRGAP